MSVWKPMKAIKPVDLDKKFIGKTITAYRTAEDAIKRSNPERLLVEDFRGNMRHLTMFQINGSHLVSMLDAFCELNGEPRPDKQTHEGFLSTELEQIIPEKQAPTLLTDRRTPKYGEDQKH